jgi:hypothetical protein
MEGEGKKGRTMRNGKGIIKRKEDAHNQGGTGMALPACTSLVLQYAARPCLAETMQKSRALARQTRW